MYDPTGQKQGQNPEIVAAIYNGAEFVVSVLFEPVDWAITAAYCASGDCDWSVLLGLLPFVPAGLTRNTHKVFDIVRYGEKVQDLIPHHGVLDIWASANIPGYARRNPNAPIILLTGSQHNKTIEVFNQWRLNKTGSITGRIDWSTISPHELQALAEQMFEAAGVPSEAREAYYKVFDKYLYEELP